MKTKYSDIGKSIFEPLAETKKSVKNREKKWLKN